ncbi:DUF1963 domain-containing protein [Paenibacillus sp. H1-7]|uniref:YwqG family protein n=1 Tax=Paenibacillus sp. H1-7 TaxID=2282849 RepID=UPI001EF94FE1|nr:YwqG family protein [Paenibacillus sp. H1-7]ULL17096.1 DUF1963 domain-containing protein [Paenibacillus sp. H1-7]
MNWNEHQRIQLESLIVEHGFAHASQYIIENTRSTIRLTKDGAADYVSSCESRVGGDPDLPSQVKWPMTSDGIPMTFLAQLHLREVTDYDESSPLPANGMLYFFVGIDEPAYNIEHRVLVVPEDQLGSAERRISPEVTALEGSYNGFRVIASPSLEPPNYAYVDYEQIENETVGYEEYEDLSFAISGAGKGEVARLFGYPMGQHDDSEYEAALMLLTGANYSYSKTEALKHLIAHFAGDETKAKQEIQDTLMLLELESDQEIGFCWWDAGVLQFFIRKEDLLAGRFDRTYCSLYSS